jgi:hypothetical protein
MYGPITKATLAELMEKHEPPCLSIYMPTHRSFPERTQDPIRFKNLVREMRASLEQQFPDIASDSLLRPFDELVDNRDFWNHTRDGVAVFGGKDYFMVYPLQRKVPELAVVNSHHYLKPILRIAQSADRYQILCLSRNQVRLFEGNRDVLDEVELAPEVPRNQDEALGSELTPKDQIGNTNGFGGAGERGDPMIHGSGGSGKQEQIDIDCERFFRAIDRAVTEHHSKPSNLPLILAALPENQTVFRSVSHNNQLLEKGISIGQGALDTEMLRQESWKLMEPMYLKRLNSILDQYGESHGQGLASDQLEEIGKATAESRVATLLVEAERQIPGLLNRESGELHPSDPAGAETADVLDELITYVMEHGGDVVVVPRDRMPCKTGAAAVYRF